MFQLSPGGADELHGHKNVYQISIPLLGRGRFRHNDEVREAGQQTRLVLTPGSIHQHMADEEKVRILLIGLKQDFIEKVITDRLGYSVSPVEFDPWDDLSNDRFRRLADYSLKRGTGNLLEGIEMQEFEWELANLLLSVQAGSHSKEWRNTALLLDHPGLKRALDFIHANVAEDLSLDTLSQVSGISKFHLIRLFRDQINRTPGQYVRQVRLERAEHLLRHTKQDVISIAFEVGFGSLSAFERAFKQKYRVPASEYRKLT